MKNKTRKIVTLTIAILLVVLIQFIGVTYAKYITSEKGSGHADIAKWAFEIVKDGEQTKTFQLLNSVNKDTLIDGKIAPGTSGTITIDIDGTGSDVDMDFDVKFTNEKNKPSNIVFTYGSNRYSSLTEIEDIVGHIEHNKPQTRRILINWVWKYNTGTKAEEISANDIIDTQDANTIDQYTFDVVVTATQSE